MHPVLAPKLGTDMIKLGSKVLCDMHVACSSFHSEAMYAGVDSLVFLFCFLLLVFCYVNMCFQYRQ